MKMQKLFESFRSWVKKPIISENLQYHIDHNVGVDRNVFRPGSEEFLSLFKEVRSLYKAGQYKLNEAEEFYEVHQSKPFYAELCNYLSSGPIVVMVLEKENAVAENRKLMGATDPKKADDGTLRKKYGISIDKNSVHGSDSLENAKIEIDFFFKS